MKREGADMNENRGKVKLNDDLLDKVAGGTTINMMVCSHCGNANTGHMMVKDENPVRAIVLCLDCCEEFICYK